VILGVTVIFFALQGKQASCICYSEYLSLQALFEHMQIVDCIYFSTISAMCEQILNQHGSGQISTDYGSAQDYSL